MAINRQERENETIKQDTSKLTVCRARHVRTLQTLLHMVRDVSKPFVEPGAYALFKLLHMVRDARKLVRIRNQYS